MLDSLTVSDDDTGVSDLSTPEKPQRPKRVPAPKWKITHHVNLMKQEGERGFEDVVDIPENSLDAAMAVVDEQTFGFFFYTMKTAHVWVEDDYCAVGQTVDVSPKHYIGGEVFAIDSIKALALDGDKTYNDLLFMMFRNDYSHIIQTRTGFWQPFLEEDVHIRED